MSDRPQARRRRRRKNSGLKNIITLLAIVLAGLLIAIALLSLAEEKASNVKTELTLEAGQAVPEAAVFLKEDKGLPISYTGSFVDTSVPGEYTVTLVYDEREYTATVTVQDTVAPVGTPQNVSMMPGDVPDAAVFLSSIQDVTDVTVTYKTQPDMTVDGKQDVTVVLTDTSGNQSEVTATLCITFDLEPPVIEGVEDFLVYVGDTISYRSGITISDAIDPAPKLSVDSGAVDLSKPGEYTVTYTATDASGNTATATAKVVVHEKKEGYVDLETIYAAVDKKLSQIIEDGMTDREKVKAIYKWARGNLGYSGHSDKDDWLQGAYVMLSAGKGDCFNYFAVCKLMFERLEIPNIDVRKVKNYDGDSDHFWSLVSVDGGETYYHFDATPRVGSGDDFCLVTDAFLDAYSASHKNCHNRDKSLYPATPEA